jgi:hypothetical protein
MKNTILFSFLFVLLCTFAPLSIALTGCNKVDAQTIISDSTAYSDDFEDFVKIIGNVPYMQTNTGAIEILRVENAHKLYSYFLTEMKDNEEMPEIWMCDWQDSSHVIVEFRNKFYYHTHEKLNNPILGILISESDYPITVCYREEIFIGEPYNLNLNNISEPLQTYCKSLIDFEAHIYPTGNPSEFKVYFGGWDVAKGEYSFFKSFIIIT